MDSKSPGHTSKYPALNRRTKTTFADGSTITYTYDKGNHLTQVVDSALGTLTYAYDGLDRLTSETTPQGAVTYTYDKAGRRTGMTVPGQTAIAYTYDKADRLTKITQGTSIVKFTYDNADRRKTATLPNGVVETYTYDKASQVTGITYKKGTTTLGAVTYAYDAAGNRIKTTGAWSRTGLPQAVASATYDAANRQLTFGNKTMTYDANGSLLTLADSSGTTSFTWNARNQLSGVSGPGVTGSFQYDALGRREVKTVGGARTEFLFDGVNPVQESSGATVTANTLTGLGVDEYFTRADSIGTRNFLTDALGSTLALTDTAGAVQAQYTYEPFGQATSTGTGTNAFQYTGRENDGTGLYYYRARYYHPGLQRFISEDPVGFGGGDVNIYVYVSNKSMNWTDSSGLTYGSNVWFLFEWFTGKGKPRRYYDIDDFQTREMANSPGGKALKDFFYARGGRNFSRFDYRSGRAWWETLANPLTANWGGTGAQVGGFGGASATSNGDGTVTFKIRNIAGRNSFFYHLVPDRKSPTGPMRNIEQIFEWTESIDLNAIDTGNGN